MRPAQWGTNSHLGRKRRAASPETAQHRPKGGSRKGSFCGGDPASITRFRPLCRPVENCARPADASVTGCVSPGTDVAQHVRKVRALRPVRPAKKGGAL